MSMLESVASYWLSIATAVSAVPVVRDGKHIQQYTVELAESVLVVLGGSPMTDRSWNDRMAYVLDEIGKLCGGDSATRRGKMSWNDLVLKRLAEISTGGISVGGITWTKLTQTMWNTGSDVSTNATLKSASFDGSNVLTLTALAMAATRDGHREMSGRSIPLASILPGFDATESDIGIMIKNPSSGGDINLIAGVAIVQNPGAAGDGVGIAVSETRVTHQGPTTVDSSITDAGLTAAFARVSVSADTVSCSVRAKGTGNGGEFYEVAGSTTNTLDALTFSSAAVFITLGSYSGVQAEDEQWSGEIYFAAIPKIAVPA